MFYGTCPNNFLRSATDSFMMSRGLGKIQKEIMDYMMESGATDTDWFTVVSIFEGLRSVQVKETKEEKVYDQHGRLLWVDTVDDSYYKSPKGREYQKQYFPIYRAIKSLEKRGLVKVRQATESEREELREQYSFGKVQVALNRRKI